MDASSPGFWLLPTYGRVDTRVPAFFKAAKETGMSTPGYLVVDQKDYAANAAAYDALDLPEGWAVHVVRGGGCSIATSEALADLLEPDTSWVGWIADDLRPETPGWDVAVIEALNGFNFVSTNDGMHAPQKFNGATAWSGDLVRAVGYITIPGAAHWYLDDLVEELARSAGNWVCLMHVMVRHLREGATVADATMARTNTAWQNDDRVYQEWLRNEKSAAVERVLAVMEAHGVALLRPELKGVRLMIATPCGDGKYESVFMRSYVETRDMLRQMGCDAHLCEGLYISDVTLARTRVLGSFLRSSDDYMLWVDADQGWNPADVVRMLSAKSDFVAAAGIRKVSPPSFAVSVADDWGRPTPIKFDGATGLLEALAVGMAFALISRACVERMVAAYPELEYEAPDGRVEHCLFMPMILNRQYRSEDYSYCHRWRAIGGRILIDPAISLKHMGPNCWEGAWIDQLEAKAREQQGMVA